MRRALGRLAFLGIFALLAAGWGGGALAQAAAFSGFGDSSLLERQVRVNVSVVPRSVAPGKKVVASVQASEPLDRAQIIWLVDGQEVTRGIAERRAVLTMPNRYGSAEVTARVIFPSGAEAEGSARVSLASVAVVWEGQGYTFPTYEGRPFAVGQGPIALHAFATVVEDGKVVPPEDLVFAWSTRGRGMAPIVGAGRDAVVIPGQLFGSGISVEVTATAPKGTQARATITIPFENPRIIFYERHPLLGMRYDRYMRPLATRADSATVVAEPMYFSVLSRTDENLSYFWEHNGAPARATGPSIVLRATGERPVTANLSLYVEHRRSVRQSAQKEFEVTFLGE